MLEEEADTKPSGGGVDLNTAVCCYTLRSADMWRVYWIIFHN